MASDEGAQVVAMTRRDGFGMTETSPAEIQAKAHAERARALVEARFVVAMRYPRDMAVVQQRLLHECTRPGFAETAEYAKPVGRRMNEVTGKWEEKFAYGPSVHFARAAFRLLGNLDASTELLYDDGDKRVTRHLLIDLESNSAVTKEIVTVKQVERRYLKKGQKAVSERENNYGDTVYLVGATEDEVFTKESAIAAKIFRQNVLAFLPADIRDECMSAARKTMDAGIRKDLDAKRSEVRDCFAYYDIAPDDLAEYLGHPIAQASPNELRTLIQIYNGMREGSVNWDEMMAERRAGRGEPKVAPPPPAAGMRDRRDATVAEYRSFVEKLGQARVDEIVGKDRSAVVTIEEHDAALVKLRDPAAHARAEPTTQETRTKESGDRDEPAKKPPAADETRNAVPTEKASPNPLAAANDAVPGIRELNAAAKDAGVNLSEFSRREYSKIPQGLNDAEKRRLLSLLQQAAKARADQSGGAR